MKDFGDYKVGRASDILEWLTQHGIDVHHVPTILEDDVPYALRVLIPLAQKWGITDDTVRVNVVEAASDLERRELVNSVLPLNGLFDDWLAGPEVHSDNYSGAYVAFTCLRMSAEYAELV